MIIMPSTPRLSTPARSTSNSPAAASSSGVDAAITARMMASSNPIGGLLGRDQTEAVEDEGIAREHEEQQDALRHLGEIERHLEGDLRLLAADEGERQKQPGDQDADRIEPSQERNNDGGESVAGGDAGLQMADRPGHLDDASQ